NGPIHINRERAVHFGRRMLSRLAIVLPPQHLQHLHAAVRARRGSIVLEELRQDGLYYFGIFFAEAGALGELRIDAPVALVDSVIDAVLHAHRVRSALASISVATHAFGYLRARDADRLLAECRLNRDWTTDRDGYAVGIAFF